MNSPIAGTPAPGSAVLEQAYAEIRAAEQSLAVEHLDPVEALDVHMLISSFCVFRVANKYTFGAIFRRNLTDRRRRAHYRRMLGDVVVAYLTS